MNEREAPAPKAVGSSSDACPQHVAGQDGGLPAGRGVVGSRHRGRGYHDWHTGLALLAQQAMVKGTDSEAVQTMKHRSRAGNNRPSLSKKSRKARKTTGAHVAKTGRPANSGDVRLSPRFRSPVDIERLGKALVAIAMRQAPEPEAGAEDDAGADTKGRDGTTGAGHDTQQ